MANQRNSEVTSNANAPNAEETGELWKTVCWFLFAALFIFAGCGHLLRGHSLLQFMPPWLPMPLALIYISGVFEILGGVGLLLPRWRRWAGIELALLLVAVFPVNIQMALHPELASVPVSMLWARLPLQFVLIALVLWCSSDKSIFDLFGIRSRQNIDEIFTDLTTEPD